MSAMLQISENKLHGNLPFCLLLRRKRPLTAGRLLRLTDTNGTFSSESSSSESSSVSSSPAATRREIFLAKAESSSLSTPESLSERVSLRPWMALREPVSLARFRAGGSKDSLEAIDRTERVSSSDVRSMCFRVLPDCELGPAVGSIEGAVPYSSSCKALASSASPAVSNISMSLSTTMAASLLDLARFFAAFEGPASADLALRPLGAAGVVETLVRDVSHSTEELSAVESNGEIVRGLSALEPFSSEERFLVDEGAILGIETSLRTLVPAEVGSMYSPSPSESSSSELFAMDLGGAVDLAERVRRLMERRLSERLKSSGSPTCD